jgi:hypothetical protein
LYSGQPGFGYKAGCTFSREISSLFFIETSLGYVFEQSQNSFQWVSSDPFNPIFSYSDWRNSFSWIELPVVVNFSFWRKGRQSLFVGAGLSTRRLLTSSMEGSTLYGSGFAVASSVNSRVNEWNFFPIVQVGGHFSVSDLSRLTVMLSYQRSISRLFKTASLPPGAVSQIGDPDFTQNAITLSVAYSVNWSSLR